MIHPLHRLEMDRYFRGQLAPAATARVLARLWSCEACRARYQRHLLLESALPDAPGREERLWSTIERSAGLAPPAVTRRRAWLAASVVLAGGALALLLLVPRLRSAHEGSEPVPRGRATAALGPRLHLYRSLGERGTEAVTHTLRAGDGLLVAYSNPSPDLRFLLVFAVDADGRVYWYHPAYERLGENPAAVPIRTEAFGVELGEEVHHPLRPGDLTVFGVFLPGPRSVLEIEELVRHARACPLDIPEASQVCLRLEVTP